MTKPLYFYNGSTFELVGPTTPQSPIAYQTSAPTAPATGDLWIDSDGDVDTYNRQLTRYYYVATAAQTTITGIDANGLTLAYVAGSEAVYVNGALQVRGQDYTATNGTSVVLSTGLAVNDVVEIFAYTAFTVANTYTKSETDGVAAAAAGLRMVVPTSVAVGSGSGSANAAGQVTFSGASSVSLNGVFSSTYDNYKILINTSAATATADLTVQLLSSGTPLTANYNIAYWYKLIGSGAFGSAEQLSRSSWLVSGLNNSSTTGETIVMELSNPFATRYKSYFANATRQDDYVWSVGGKNNTTTSYDGFRIIPTSGNISGTVSIYGYKD